MQKYEEYKTVSEAAILLNISPDTIRRWEKKGLIRAVRDPKKNYRYFNIKELERVNQKYLDPSTANINNYKILKSEKTVYNSIELFSGAGGLALGLDNAGFNTKVLIENDKYSVETLKANFEDVQILQEDITKFDFEIFKENFYDIDLIAGGFPCQAFSYAGKSLGLEDTRGTLFFDYARCIKALKPKLLLAENVRGLVNHENGKVLKTMLKVLKDLGYRTYHRVLKAQFFDVPQKRERLFIIGIREDINIRPNFPIENDYVVTLREAFENCPESPGAKYPPRKKEIFDMVPEGGYWRDLPIEVQKEYMGGSFYLGGGKTGMARRLSWDEPSLTLTCSPAQKQTERCHPSETRPLNVREYARIQTFPDDWGFCGGVPAQYKQIGNAVPVNLAYHVGRSLIEILDRQKKGESDLMDMDIDTEEKAYKQIKLFK